MPTTKTETKVEAVAVATKLPARCYLDYGAYMDWHLDHRTKPVMSQLEWRVNRKRILDQQD
jgi:hypothetical protein